MKKEMLINVLQPEESRIAIIEDGVLEELYVERSSHESYVGNIYKGRIVNIEPSIQAAFVDFGVGRNGFLHVSDVEPAYYRHLDGFHSENGNRRRRGGGKRPRRRYNERDEEDDAVDESELDETEIFEAPDDGEEFEQRVDIDEPEEFEVIDDADDDDAVDIEKADSNDDKNNLSGDEDSKSDDKDGITADSANDIEEKLNGDADDTAADKVETSTTEGIPDAQLHANDEKDVAPQANEETDDSSPGEEAHSEHDHDEVKTSEVREANEIDDSSGGESDGIVFGQEAPENTAIKINTEQEASAAAHAETATFSADDKVIEVPANVSLHEPAPDETEPQPTLVMQSTERRTETSIVAEDDASSEISDEELSFSMSRDDDGMNDDAAANVTDDGEDAVVSEKRDEVEESVNGRRNDESVIDEPRDRDRRRGPRNYSSRSDEQRRRGRGGPRGPRRQGFGRPKPLIQDIFRKGQEVLVQVIKEGIGTKGPTLSTYISIAGRYLVLMPGLNRIGVSRKIVDEEQRRRLRELMHDLQPPKGLGFIIRTAGIDRTKKDLQRDLGYLSRLWEVVVRRIRKIKAPAEIYEESDMITRTIRDTFSSEIDTIWVDEQKAFEHAQEFLQIVMPRYANRIKRYEGNVPMFHKYGIENEISKIQQRTVPLQHGGSIVIDQTEALVAIDVNSGNFRADNNAEETAFQMNLLAAREIARQLRLRDMGGVIVNDFIDMRDEKHRRSVERALREAVKRDRARTKILKISAFGIIEMTRQRIRPSLKRSIYQDCAHCLGAGQVKSCESMSIDVMRLLQLAAQRDQIRRLDVHVHEDVAHYLLNRKRKEVAQIEEGRDIEVSVSGEPNVPPETLEFFCYDNNNNEVKFLFLDEPKPVKRRRD